jgi:Gpi18-like mannosyltransferase
MLPGFSFLHITIILLFYILYINNKSLNHSECTCSKWASKVLEPVRVSHSRIIYRCRECDGIVCWSDVDMVFQGRMKIRPNLEGFNEKILHDFV